MSKDEVIVMCEKAIDAFEHNEEGAEKVMLDTLYEARSYLIYGGGRG